MKYFNQISNCSTFFTPTFPKKSPSYVTEKFVKHYKSINCKKTISEWHDEWWNWMTTERPSYGNDKLEEERDNIIDEVLQDVYDKSYQVKEYVYSDDGESHFMFLYEDYSYETYKEAVELHVEYGNFARYNDYYYNLKEYEASPEWKAAVDKELREIQEIEKGNWD